MLCDADKKQFSDIFDSLGDMYGKEVTIQTKRLYWSTLCSMSMADIESAISKHLLDEDRGRFFPKPADIARAVNGPTPSADEVVGMAMAANTPFGIIARIIIGTWDLQNMDSFYLRQRAEEVLAMLPDIKKRAGSGRYTPHEIEIMLKHRVDPRSPLLPGSADLKQEAIAAITATTVEVKKKLAAIKTEEVKVLPEADRSENREKVVSLMAKIAERRASR